MKKNKGFTLVEILAVITILTLVVIITVPSLDTVLKKASDKSKKEQEKVIFEATKNYMSEYNLTLENDFLIIDFEDLKKSEFLSDKEYYDASTKEKYENAIIYVHNEDNKTNYDLVNNFVYNDVSSTDSCFIHDNGAIKGVDHSKSGCENLLDIDFPTAIDGVPITSIEKPDDEDNYYVLNDVENISFSNCLFLETIGEDAFEGDSNDDVIFETLNLANNVKLKTIESSGLSIDGVVYNSVIFPPNLVYIGEYAFAGNGFKMIEVPSSVMFIEPYAFFFCKIEVVIYYGKKNEDDFESYDTSAYIGDNGGSDGFIHYKFVP